MNDLANSPMTPTSPPKRIDFNTPEMQRKRRIRALKDRFTRWYVLVGGLAVLAAITLIFFFLAYVVVPLFKGADLTVEPTLHPAWLQDAGKPLVYALEEQNEVLRRQRDSAREAERRTRQAGWQTRREGFTKQKRPLLSQWHDCGARWKNLKRWLRTKTSQQRSVRSYYSRRSLNYTKCVTWKLLFWKLNTGKPKRKNLCLTRPMKTFARNGKLLQQYKKLRHVMPRKRKN